jgi:hypothetical protein
LENRLVEIRKKNYLNIMYEFQNRNNSERVEMKEDEIVYSGAGGPDRDESRFEIRRDHDDD